ncbi:MAG: type II toxin-antitoxin system HicB family antitoxin [Lachnospiraceae bacterium]|jgi:predicted HicB family RNase H-like nuclease|nr:type II toxin-antitoxin system HicB family antitoxin [Lachnospiraceae bacterium]
MKYKDYYAEIKYSDEDRCFWGKIEGLKKDLILFEGNTVEELRKDFENAIDIYIESCKKNNEEPQRQYKGSFNVRIEPNLHKEAIIFAKSLTLSLNQFVALAIQDKIKSIKGKV